MKTKILNNEERSFKPIELNITIESKRELEALACLTNASGNGMMRFCNENRYNKIEAFDVRELEWRNNLWRTINQIIDTTDH